MFVATATCKEDCHAQMTNGTIIARTVEAIPPNEADDARVERESLAAQPLGTIGCPGYGPAWGHGTPLASSADCSRIGLQCSLTDIVLASGNVSR